MRHRTIICVQLQEQILLIDFGKPSHLDGSIVDASDSCPLCPGFESPLSNLSTTKGSILSSGDKGVGMRQPAAQ